MGLFRRRNPAQEAAESAARGAIQFDPEGPERAAAEARDAASRGDYAVAFERGVKGVDRLHDFYVFERFRNRQPSEADAPIVGCLLDSLRLLRERDSQCDVRDGVVEATHRLRTISTATDGIGGNSALYRQGLDGLAALAPDVDVSGVFWS